jgi:Carboxypeptidase regulatory-like domain
MVKSGQLMRRFEWLEPFFLWAVSTTLPVLCAAQMNSAPIPSSGSLSQLSVTVLDENGVAIRSALVVLTSSQTNSRRCETDFAGHCLFTGLAAGSYQLRAEKLGFYSSVRPVLQVQANTGLDVTLNHQQEVRQVVNVNESPPVIDPAQISSKEQLSGLEIIDIPYPATHDYRNVLDFIPGVIQDSAGQPHVVGAETYQTVTLLDGFNVTQPANGQLLVRVSTDAFRSIEVEPSREPAEDGKGSGGVLDLTPAPVMIKDTLSQPISFLPCKIRRV